MKLTQFTLAASLVSLLISQHLVLAQEAATNAGQDVTKISDVKIVDKTALMTEDEKNSLEKTNTPVAAVVKPQSGDIPSDIYVVDIYASAYQVDENGNLDNGIVARIYARYIKNLKNGNRIVVGATFEPEALIAANKIKKQLIESDQFRASIEDGMKMAIAKAVSSDPSAVNLPPAFLNQIIQMKQQQLINAGTITANGNIFLDEKLNKGAIYEAFQRELFIQFVTGDWTFSAGKMYCDNYVVNASQVFCASVPGFKVERQLTKNLKVGFKVYNGRLLSMENPSGLPAAEVEQIIKHVGGILNYTADSGEIIVTANNTKVGTVVASMGIRAGDHKYLVVNVSDLQKLVPLKQIQRIKVSEMSAVENSGGSTVIRFNPTVAVPFHKDLGTVTGSYYLRTAGEGEGSLRSAQLGVQHHMFDVKSIDVDLSASAYRSTGSSVVGTVGSSKAINGVVVALDLHKKISNMPVPLDHNRGVRKLRGAGAAKESDDN